MCTDNLRCFLAGVHPRSLGHSLDSSRKDYEMRKGFTREPRRDEPATQVKNYITPSGLQRLKDEHRFLLSRERPAMTEVVAWAASNGDRSENADYQYGKRRLRQIDGRIRFLTKRIEAAEVVDPEAPRRGRRRRGHSLERRNRCSIFEALQPAGCYVVLDLRRGLVPSSVLS